MPVPKEFHTASWIVVYDADPARDIETELDPDTCGKWMMYFAENEQDWVHDIITEAVESGACGEAKMSNPLNIMVYGGTGVACFYIVGTDEEQHRTLLSFMLEKGLFPHDGNGRLTDKPFKFDWQTAAGQYGDSFVPEIVLSDFVDLDTGEFL